ncbi:hypothetical protein ACOSOMT5_P2463 [Acidiphilium sp. MT5]
MIAPAIRRLNPIDAPDYRTIRLDALKHNPEAFGSTYETEQARPIAEFEQRLIDNIVFGAYVEGAIVGMAGLRRQVGQKDSHKAYVWGMYVQPACRGTGIGSALLHELILVSQTLVEQLTLSIVKGNDPAATLYRKFGFQIYGVEPRALKTADGYNDEIHMIKFLKSASETFQ